MTMSHWCLGLVSLLAATGAAAAPGLGEEQVPPGEEQAIAAVREAISQTVEKDFRESKDGVARRDAHAKHHGCVNATFTVNQDIPESLRAGVLSVPGQSYPAWIRFSNGDGHVRKDSKSDGRGMAIKLMNVDGEKLLDEERNERTQDFLMINHPVFFIRNAGDYMKLFDAITKTGAPIRFFFPNPIAPWTWHLHELLNVGALSFKSVNDPLTLRYWSMTPYRLGKQAIKFSAVPCAGATSASPFAAASSDPNRLRDAMKARLSRETACYDFMVQPQTDPVAMPIEDPTVEWSEKRSPFVKVARITIARQNFDTPEQQTFCENLSFTPWHSLAEHRPLGGINRARKTVYQAISALRHHLNGAERREPTSDQR